MYESKTIIAKSQLSSVESGVRLQYGAESFGGSTIVVQDSDPIECSSTYHVLVEAGGGELRISTIDITAEFVEDQHQVSLRPGKTYSIPFWAIGLLFVFMFVFTSRPLRRARRRAELGLCLACGYDLQGLTANRCPECGTGFAPGSDETAAAVDMEPT